MPSTRTEPEPGAWGAVADWQLPLSQLCDSALPTGAFSHSFGLESYVNDGTVGGEAAFVAWMGALVDTQLTHSEGLGLRLALEAVAQDSWGEVERISELLVAQAVPAQVRSAGLTMGERMLTIARTVASQASRVPTALERYASRVELGACRPHPAVVLAVVGHDLGAPGPAVTAAYIQSSVISLTQNAVRSIPLGQSAGQRAITAVRPHVLSAVAAIGELTELDFGAAAPGIEIAQMRHERLRSRMFMS